MGAKALLVTCHLVRYEVESILMEIMQLNGDGLDINFWECTTWLDRVGRFKIRYCKTMILDLNGHDGRYWDFPEGTSTVLDSLWYDYLNPQHFEIILPPRRSPSEIRMITLEAEIRDILEALEGYLDVADISFTGNKFKDIIMEWTEKIGFEVAKSCVHIHVQKGLLTYTQPMFWQSLAQLAGRVELVLRQLWITAGW